MSELASESMSQGPARAGSERSEERAVSERQRANRRHSAVAATASHSDSASDDWLEFGVDCPADSVNDVLAGSVAPFLAAGRAAGLFGSALFLRRLGDGPTAPVTVQLRPTAPAATIQGLAARHGIGHPTLTTATQVPTSGAAFGGPRLAPVTREFLAEVSPGLLDVLVAHPRSTPGRLSAALELMITHLVAVGASALPDADRVRATLNGAPLSFLSYTSHAEAFLATCRDPALARTGMRRRHEQIRPVVEQRVTAIFADPDRGEPPAGRWLRAVRTAKPPITAEFAHGGIRPVDAIEDVPDLLAASSFHRTLADSGDFRRFLGSDPGFLAVRLLTSLLYLSVHNLGLSLLERYFLCYSISNACESVFDVDGRRTLAALTG